MNQEARVAEFFSTIKAIRDAIGKVMVGQQALIEQVLVAMVAGGHVLLEGVPGLGKTLLVRTLGQVLDLSYNRVQFTPDLMPADISGTMLVVEKEAGRKVFEFQPGPLFANLVLADEVNRATPKTQSALLEAMQEHAVTVSGQRHPLPEPFFVMATQNPIEMEGTYPLPEAQVDRFLFKLQVPVPAVQEIVAILERTTGGGMEFPPAVAGAERIRDAQRLAGQVLAANHVLDYAARLMMCTHPDFPDAIPMARKFVRYGASPRGAQALIMAGKVRALFQGRFNLSIDDVRSVVHPSLRHRLILNFEGEAEGITTDAILDDLIREVKDVETRLPV